MHPSESRPGQNADLARSANCCSRRPVQHQSPTGVNVVNFHTQHFTGESTSPVEDFAPRSRANDRPEFLFAILPWHVQRQNTPRTINNSDAAILAQAHRQLPVCSP